MAMQVFNWFPDIDSELSVKPSAQVTKFGDGYEARTVTGLNTMPEKWSLTFVRDRATVLSILAFLKQHAAVLAFRWTSPNEEQGTYVCREWKTRNKRGVMELTCTFEQVFEN